jgi:hypothetical protein
MHAGLVAGMDHALAIAPASRHRLLGHDMTAGGGYLDGLLGVQAAGGGQNYDIGVGPGEQRFQAPKAGGTGSLLCASERGRIDVANADQLSPFGMFLDSGKVVFRDPAAADERESDAPVGDEGLGDEHPRGFHDGGEDSRSPPCTALQRRTWKSRHTLARSGTNRYHVNSFTKWTDAPLRRY